MNARQCGCLPSLALLSLNQAQTQMRYDNIRRVLDDDDGAPDWVKRRNQSGAADASRRDDTRLPPQALAEEDECPICQEPYNADPAEFIGDTEEETENRLAIEVLQEAGEAQRAERATQSGLDCGHVFHATCIVRWVGRQFRKRQRPSCPVCRTGIPSDRAEALNSEYLRYAGLTEYTDSEEDDGNGQFVNGDDQDVESDDSDEDEPGLNFRQESYGPEPPSLELSDAFERIFEQFERDLTAASPPDPAAQHLDILAHSIRFAAHTKFQSEAQPPEDLEIDLVDTLNREIEEKRMDVLTSTGTNGRAFLRSLSDEGNSRLQEAREAFQVFLRGIAAQWLEFAAAIGLYDEPGYLRALLPSQMLQ